MTRVTEQRPKSQYKAIPEGDITNKEKATINYIGEESFLNLLYKVIKQLVHLLYKDLFL